LQLTDVHLTGFRPDGVIQILRGSKFLDVIAHLFKDINKRGVETALRLRWAKYYAREMTCSRLYYDSSDTLYFSTLNKLRAAANNVKKFTCDIRPWLQKKRYVYASQTLQKAIRKQSLFVI